MNRSFLKYALATLGAAALGAMISPSTKAACFDPGSGKTPLGRRPDPLPNKLVLRPISFQQLEERDNASGRDGESRHESIVGFWHVKFVSKDNQGIPDGTEIDAGYQQWHSDGTEVLFSAGRKPMGGDVCFGVWEKIGARDYKLNHFAAPWDEAQTQLIGPTNFLMKVALNHEGIKFTGSFAIKSYDESGNLLSQITGVITGTRIEVDTPPESIF